MPVSGKGVTGCVVDSLQSTAPGRCVGAAVVYVLRDHDGVGGWLMLTVFRVGNEDYVAVAAYDENVKTVRFQMKAPWGSGTGGVY